MSQIMDIEVEDKISELSARLSEELVDELPNEPNPLVSKQSQKQKAQYEVASDLRYFAERIATGLKEIDQIKDKLAPFEPHVFTPEVLEAIHALCREEKGLQTVALESLQDKQQKKAIKDILGISAQVVRALYRSGAEIYNEKRYQEAAAAFTVITLMEIPAHDAWIALGNSEYYCQHYQSALIAYAMAAWSDPSNPVSHFYSAHCYEALREYDNAINAVDIALFVLKDNPKYSDWEKKAKDLKQRLKQLLSKK